jgi:hypothetical protein
MYMAYDRQAGPSEAAILVFHHTAKQARYLAWSEEMGDWGCEFVDAAATRLGAEFEHLWSLYYGDGLPLLITNPPTCPCCKVWGYKLTDDGKHCEGCCCE